MALSTSATNTTEGNARHALPRSHLECSPIELGVAGALAKIRPPFAVRNKSAWLAELEKNYPSAIPKVASLRDDILPRYVSSAKPTMPTTPDHQRHTTLPPKLHSRLVRNFRHTWMSLYRRLHLLVLIPNLVAMIMLGMQHDLLKLSPTTVTTAVAVNITASVLMRQELVINLLFIIIGRCPHWVPLRLRCFLAKVYHFGGVHSGAAVAATVWFAVFNAVIIRMAKTSDMLACEIRVFVVTVLIDLLLLSILVFAYPKLRQKYHNAFEFVHRLAGWGAVFLFWVQLVVLSDMRLQSEEGQGATLYSVLIQSPAFYCLLVVTISIIFPWLRLRKVPVRTEHLSEHACRLHFMHANLPLCAAPRVSDNPLREWHSFAGIPEESGTGFSMIISNAGDWTNRIIKSPPTSLWIRGLPVRGVLHVAPIFKRMILVATGSGVGPILSLLYARGLDCRILWSTRDPQLYYQPSIVQSIYLADPNAVIINTTVSGYPDLLQEAYNLFVTSGAEAVFVISNPKVCRKVVYGLESRGVPAFAPIFDS